MTVENNAPGVEQGAPPAPAPAQDNAEAGFMALMEERLGEQTGQHQDQSRPGQDQVQAQADKEAAKIPEQDGQTQAEGTPKEEGQGGSAPGAEKRIGQLTYKVKESERKFDEAQRELALAQTRIRDLEAQAYPELGEEPKQDNYESQEEYQYARMGYEAQKGNLEFAKKQNRVQVDRARKDAVHAHDQRMLSLVNEQIQGNSEFAPDFETVVRATEVSGVMRDILASSEHFGPAAYYLAKNPQVANEIMSLPAQGQAVRMANLLVHAALQQEKQNLSAPRGTAVPPPITPVPSAHGGGGFDSTNPNLTFDDYRKQHGERLLKER